MSDRTRRGTFLAALLLAAGWGIFDRGCDTAATPSPAATSGSPRPSSVALVTSNSPSPSPSDVDSYFVTVPAVEGKPVGKAEAELQALGLFYERITVERPDVPDGTVIEVVPAAGEQVARGSEVTLRVTMNLVQIPDVTGQIFVHYYGDTADPVEGG